MFRDTVLRCLVIVTIVRTTLTSGEPCAYGVRLIWNSTGYYVTWSSLGQNCGDTWLRINLGENSRDYKDTLFTSSPMLIPTGYNARVTCRNTTICDIVTDIDVIIATSLVPTTRPTTSTRSVITTSQNVVISNTATPVPGRGPENEFPTLVVVVAVVCSVVVLVMVIILVVCLAKGRRTQPVATGEEVAYSEIAAVTPPSRDVYAVVVKVQDRSDTPASGDTYAVVQKPNKESSPAADPGSLYAEVQKPTNASKQPMLQQGTNGPNQNVSRYKNKDGLIYLDVDFGETADQKETGHPLLDCHQRDCEYAEVQHT